MQYSAYAGNSAELQLCATAPEIREILIECRTLSISGVISVAEAVTLATEARAMRLSPVLVCDRPLNQSALHDCATVLNSLPEKAFDAVRLADWGAVGLWCSNLRLTQQTGLQLLCEHGFRNAVGLNRVTEYLYSRNGCHPSRIILSPELDKTAILNISRGLRIPVEVLAAGPLLLSHVARPTLSTPAISANSARLTAACRDAGPTPLVFTENENGTCVYHGLDLCILPQKPELEKEGIKHLRIDTRQLSEPERKVLFEQLSEDPAAATWPHPHSTTPFMLETAATIKRELPVPPEWQRRSIATVIATRRERYVAFRALKNTALPATAEFRAPDGIGWTIEQLICRSPEGAPVSAVNVGEIFLTDWFPRASCRVHLLGGTSL